MRQSWGKGYESELLKYEGLDDGREQAGNIKSTHDRNSKHDISETCVNRVCKLRGNNVTGLIGKYLVRN